MWILSTVDSIWRVNYVTLSYHVSIFSLTFISFRWRWAVSVTSIVWQFRYITDKLYKKRNAENVRSLKMLLLNWQSAIVLAWHYRKYFRLQGRQSTRDRGDATHQSLCWGGHQLHCPPPPKVEWRYRSLALLILGLNNVLFPYDFCEVQKAPKSTAAGLRPGPHWGSLQRSPRPTVMLVLGLGLKESLRTISWSLALALRTKSLALALKQSPWIGLVECGYNIAY